jgi:RNA polymerase sigma factor (sigma-70 family)
MWLSIIKCSPPFIGFIGALVSCARTGTFVRVFKSSKSFRSDQRFSSWLFTIAANLARNHFRWRSRHPNVSLDAEHADTKQSLGSTLPANNPAPNEEALASERAKAVRDAVDQLPDDMREAIVLSGLMWGIIVERTVFMISKRKKT